VLVRERRDRRSKGGATPRRVQANPHRALARGLAKWQASPKADTQAPDSKLHRTLASQVKSVRQNGSARPNTATESGAPLSHLRSRARPLLARKEDLVAGARRQDARHLDDLTNPRRRVFLVYLRGEREP